MENKQKFGSVTLEKREVIGKHDKGVYYVVVQSEKLSETKVTFSSLEDLESFGSMVNNLVASEKGGNNENC